MLVGTGRVHPGADAPRQPISQTPFDLPVRRDLRWDFSEVEPRFVADDILVNYLWTALSIAAPGIEKFFISALRPLADQIADTKLREDMDNMLAQEALHAATHAKFNRALAARGARIKRASAHVDELVRWISSRFSPMDMVGLVAAGEHLIYSFAVIYMTDETIRAAMSPAARRLFDYHMLEEAEHAAVSHDIFRYLCHDSYLHRVRTAFISVWLVNALLLGTVRILIEDGSERVTWRNWLRFWSYAVVRPGLLRLMAGRFVQYVNPFYRLTLKIEDQAARDEWERRLYAGQSATT
jgi:hypothetical protein